MSFKLLYTNAPTRYAGEATSELWESDDELVVHNYHDDWTIKKQIDTIHHFRQMAEQRGMTNNLLAVIPESMYHKWKREWEAGPCKDMSWDKFRDTKLNSSEYQQLRMFSEMPMIHPKQDPTPWV